MTDWEKRPRRGHVSAARQLALCHHEDFEMAEKNWTLVYGDVFQTTRAVVERATVLTPFATHIVRPEDLLPRTIGLRKFWCWCVPELFPGATKVQRAYMLNCPPSYIFHTPPRRPCQRTRACPFCHARQAGDAWDAMYDMAFSERPESRLDSDDQREVSQESKILSWTIRDEFPLDETVSDDRLQAWLRSLQATVQPRFQALGLKHGLRYCPVYLDMPAQGPSTCDPSITIDGSLLAVAEQRWLFLAPKNFKLSQVPEGGVAQFCTDSRKKPASRRSSDAREDLAYKPLRNAVIRTLAYPISLLRHPNRAATARLLHALQQSRMRAFAVYGRSKTKDAEES